MYDAAAEVLFGDSGMFNLPAPAGGGPRRAPTTQEVAAAKLAAVPEGNVKRAKCQTCGQLLPSPLASAACASPCCAWTRRGTRACARVPKPRRVSRPSTRRSTASAACRSTSTFHTAEAAARAYDAKAREVLGEEAAKKPGVTNFSSVEEADAKVEAAEAKLRAEGIPLDPIKTKQRSSKKRETPGGVVWKDGRDAPPVSPADAGGKRAGKETGRGRPGGKETQNEHDRGRERRRRGRGGDWERRIRGGAGGGAFRRRGGIRVRGSRARSRRRRARHSSPANAQAKKNGGKNTIAQLLGDGF